MDLDEFEKRLRGEPPSDMETMILRQPNDVVASLEAGRQVALALIARVRELEAFVIATPDAGLQADKVDREDFPGLFTDEDGSAMYMDEAKRRLLAKGARLAPEEAAP